MKHINRLIASIGCAILRAWIRLDPGNSRRAEIDELLAEYDRKVKHD